MKRFPILFLMIPVVFFFSCSDDSSSDEEEDFLAPLVGTWMITTQTNSGCTMSDYNGTLDWNNSSSLLITITSDGSYTVSVCGTVDETGTISDVTETELTLCESGDNDCTPDSYVLSGNTLTVTTSDDEEFPGCTINYTLAKDTDPADLLEPFVGQWTLTSITASSCDDSSQEGTEECTECPVLTIAANCSYSFVFPDDGNGSDTETGYIVVSSTTILLCEDDSDEDCEFEDDGLMYTLSGTTLSVVSDDDNDLPGCSVSYNLVKTN
ncbi:MAG: hypothetical protein NXI20_15630 [bacterium]|nr:hypothetical protein [bacterium]